MLISDTFVANVRFAMNKDRLSEWVEREHSKGSSYAEIGRRLGVTGAAVIWWRDKKTKRLDTRQLSAIAAYRGESVADTCDWLEMDVPDDASLIARVESMTEAIKSLQQSVAEIQDILTSGGLTPSPLAVALQDALAESGIDIRTNAGRDDFLQATAKCMGDEIEARQALLMIIGAAQITPRDHPVLAEAMRCVLGSSWNAVKLMKLADKKPKAQNGQIPK